MGCDIHTHVEINKTINGEKKWICGDYFKINPYYDGVDKYEPKYNFVRFCDDRNYSLFATLADVRNYGNTTCIDTPRGLPNDVSPEVKEEAEGWGIDGHSHSYFTLRELIEFQEKAPPLKYRGMISPEAQKALDEEGITPSSWCQGTNMGDWQWREWEVKNEVLLPLIAALKQRADELYLIYDWKWDDDYEEALKLAENIRIVFWFDN